MQQESRPTGDVYIMKTTISVIEPTYVTALAILKHFFSSFDESSY